MDTVEQPTQLSLKDRLTVLLSAGILAGMLGLGIVPHVEASQPIDPYENATTIDMPVPTATPVSLNELVLRREMPSEYTPQETESVREFVSVDEVLTPELQNEVKSAVVKLVVDKYGSCSVSNTNAGLLVAKHCLFNKDGSLRDVHVEYNGNTYEVQIDNDNIHPTKDIALLGLKDPSNDIPRIQLDFSYLPQKGENLAYAHAYNQSNWQAIREGINGSVVTGTVAVLEDVDNGTDQIYFASGDADHQLTWGSSGTLAVNGDGKGVGILTTLNNSRQVPYLTNKALAMDMFGYRNVIIWGGFTHVKDLLELPAYAPPADGSGSKPY